MHTHCASLQPKKVEGKKYDESRGMSTSVDEGPLDDPIAEKLRQQRLVEEADFKAALELFGGGARRAASGNSWWGQQGAAAGLGLGARGAAGGRSRGQQGYVRVGRW